MTQVPEGQDGVTVALLGTFDTKGREYAFLGDRLREHGVKTFLVDVGVFQPNGVEPDITQRDVARAGGADVSALAATGDRGAAVATMAKGAEAVLTELYRSGRIHAVLALGGSGGTAIATAAMRSLPVGVPKLMVSTVASGDTRAYVGSSDVTMMPSVVDISGVNAVSSRILSNAAAAMAGMVTVGSARDRGQAADWGHDVRRDDALRHASVPVPRKSRLRGTRLSCHWRWRPGDGGVRTTRAAGRSARHHDHGARRRARGRDNAGQPGRLESAGTLRIPQVVSLGALDMVNFGPRSTVPPAFEGRKLYVHNPTVTLMRTSPDECHELGRRLGEKLAATAGPKTLFVPLRGVSAIAVEGQPFYDPDADAALLSGLHETMGDVEVREMDMDINDERFAEAMARRLVELIRGDDEQGTGNGAPQSSGREWAADHRDRCWHRPVCQMRGGRRRRPDHYLQFGPFPHGRAGVARRAAPVRGRQ